MAQADDFADENEIHAVILRMHSQAFPLGAFTLTTADLESETTRFGTLLPNGSTALIE